VQFKVKHLMITTISGHFHSYDLEVLTDGDDFTTASKIEFAADVDSISTKNGQCDAHLKSAEFFNAEQHVVINFSGKKFEQNADEYLLHGDPTIKAVTKPIYSMWTLAALWWTLMARPRRALPLPVK
jgi:polyisoprenoid-binding protein YceI